MLTQLYYSQQTRAILYNVLKYGVLRVFLLLDGQKNKKKEKKGKGSRARGAERSEGIRARGAGRGGDWVRGDSVAGWLADDGGGGAKTIKVCNHTAFEAVRGGGVGYFCTDTKLHHRRRWIGSRGRVPAGAWRRYWRRCWREGWRGLLAGYTPLSTPRVGTICRFG